MAAALALLIDAVTASLFAFCAVVLVFAVGLFAVGFFAPVKRSRSGSIL
jgi:hypothetical protein